MTVFMALSFLPQKDRACRGPRGEMERPSLDAAVRRRVVFLKPPRIGIAASEIRRRLGRKRSVRYWLPDPVLAYIKRHGLYGPRH